MTSNIEDGGGSDPTDSGDRIDYEFKTGLNETRENLQGEGSNHQPVVFVGGPGYVPPNSLRQRPPLEANPLWETRPVGGGGVPETRYPQSPWDRNYRNPYNMTRVQRKLITSFQNYLYFHRRNINLFPNKTLTLNTMILLVH
jgi:hypothetical protein